jgi:hypothetical protein
MDRSTLIGLAIFFFLVIFVVIIAIYVSHRTQLDALAQANAAGAFIGAGPINPTPPVNPIPPVNPPNTIPVVDINTPTVPVVPDSDTSEDCDSDDTDSDEVETPCVDDDTEDSEESAPRRKAPPPVKKHSTARVPSPKPKPPVDDTTQDDTRDDTTQDDTTESRQPITTKPRQPTPKPKSRQPTPNRKPRQPIIRQQQNDTFTRSDTTVSPVQSSTASDSSVRIGQPDNSSTRSEARPKTRGISIIDSQGELTTINLPKLPGVITDIQSSSKHLYAHVEGKGIYQIKDNGEVKCHVSTNNNRDASLYRLDGDVTGFILGSKGFYLLTAQNTYKLIQTGFAETRDIPRCLCAAMDQDVTITYDAKGSFRVNKHAVTDNLVEPINTTAGIRLANNYLYYITITGNLVRAQLKNYQLKRETLVAEGVTTFDAFGDDYCYITSHGELCLYRDGYAISCPDLDFHGETRLSLGPDKLYIASCY